MNVLILDLDLSAQLMAVIGLPSASRAWQLGRGSSRSNNGGDSILLSNITIEIAGKYSGLKCIFSIPVDCHSEFQYGRIEY